MSKNTIIKNARIASSLFKILVNLPLRIIKDPIVVTTKNFIKLYTEIRKFCAILQNEIWRNNAIKLNIYSKNSDSHSLKPEEGDHSTEIYSFLSSVPEKAKPLISFLSPMRCLGNEDEHKPYIFLDSLLKYTKNLDNVEIIIGIDSNDDIKYFAKLKKRYVNQIKNFKVILSPEIYGYKNLHLYDKFLYEHISASSKMIADFSDDCRIIKDGWDKYLLKIDKEIPDNIYFIHTSNLQREKYVGKIGDDFAKLIWCQQAFAPASYFPIVSVGVLKIAQECLSFLNEEQKLEWSPFANSSFYDCYIDIISHCIKEGKIKRIFYQNLIAINQQFRSEKRKNPIIFDKDVNLCYDKSGLSPNDCGFLKILEPDTKKHLKNIADKISEEIQILESR